MDAMASQITRVSKHISLKSERKQNLLLRKCMRRCLRSIGLFCLLNRLCGCRSKKASKLHVTGLCAGNSPGTGEFPAQMASYAENVSIWWRHHVFILRLHDTIRDIPSFNILVLRNALLKEKTYIIISRILKALRLLNANTSKLWGYIFINPTKPFYVIFRGIVSFQCHESMAKIPGRVSVFIFHIYVRFILLNKTFGKRY